MPLILPERIIETETICNSLRMPDIRLNWDYVLVGSLLLTIIHPMSR
jgi:hypothetical protein